MRFGDIRQILDKYTEECKDCHDEDCSYDCSFYAAKQIKKDIMSLIDNVEISTSAINSIPCKLSFKGMIPVLPETGNDGDLWYLQNDDSTCKHGNYYYYDNKWNYIPVQEFLK